MTLPSKVFPSLAFLLIMLYGFSVSAKELKTPEAGVVKIIGQLEKGTGFIFQLAPDTAYIVTASHVVEATKQPEIMFFQNDKPFPASVKGTEGEIPRGLALLVVSGKENLPSGLSALPLAPSVPLGPPDEIIVIGFPRFLDVLSIIKGNIVARKGRDIIFSGPIQKGISGGPMIKEGRVVGLVTETATPYSYATPAASIKLFLEGYQVPLPKETSGLIWDQSEWNNSLWE